MATLSFCTGFEHKFFTVCGGTVTPAESRMWGLSTGPPVTEGTIVHHGTASMRCNPVASQSNVGLNLVAGQRVKVISGFVYFATLPSTGLCRIFTCPDATNPYYVGVSVAGKWIAVANTGTTITSADGPVTGRWYNVEMRVNATNQTVDWRIDGVEQTQATGAGGAADLISIRLGATTATSVDLYMDCVAVSDTSADYPLGPYIVDGLRPTEDVDITQVGAGAFQDDVGTAISGSNPAWDNLTLIEGAGASPRVVQTAIAGTGYIKVGFETSTRPGPPIAVNAIAGLRAASTAATNAQVQVDDNGSLDTFTGLFDPSEATNVNRFKILTSRPAGGAWTDEALASLAMRFGYSTDANPDAWFTGLIFEVAFVDEPWGSGDPFVAIPFIPQGTQGRSF